MNFLKSFSLALLSTLSMTISCMEISSTEQMQAQPLTIQQHVMLDLNTIPMDTGTVNLEKIKQKLETRQWLHRIIQPLNAGRFHPAHKGAQVNCTLIAEKCARALARLEEPSLVPVKREDLDITFRENDQGSIVYHEVIRKEQAELVSSQQFIETIDILEAAKAQVDLTQTLERNSLKYITSTLSTIATDIQAISGSAASEGEDKTLCGLIYYYYKDTNAGHLANFYRDKYGNLFFVDAQSESITETPPTQILNYELKDAVFFYSLIPKSGYFIKREPEVSQEQSDHRFEDTAIKLQLKDEEAREQTDSMADIIDQELFENVTSEESLIEEDTSDDLNNLNQKHITGHKRKRIEDKSYKCDQCDYSSAYSGDLNKHKHTHAGEKPYTCEMCNKVFATSSHLNNHNRTHTGEKPYQCNQCEKTFTDPANLKRHERIHTGEKPYKCDLCDKAFTQAGTLKIHKRSHTGEKPFQCDQCNYSSAHSGDLKKHKRTHTEGLLQCSLCDKAFTSSSSLKRHKRSHTGEKPFHCDQCDKAFADSSYLKIHKRTHTREKPYKCDQ